MAFVACCLLFVTTTHGLSSGRLTGADLWSFRIFGYLNRSMTIVGPGYFIVREPETQDLYLTRGGMIYSDDEGYLVNQSGFRYQGQADGGLGLLTDLIGPSTSTTQLTDTGFRVESDGLVSHDGRIIGRLSLAPGSEAGELEPIANDLYWSKEPLQPGAAGSGGLGTIAFNCPSEPTPPSVTPGMAILRPLDPTAPTGQMTKTGVSTDLAIRGPGFFLVRSPESGETFVTRVGAFKLSPEGLLVTYTGLRVQSWRKDKLVDTSSELPGASCGALEPSLRVVDFELGFGNSAYFTMADGSRTPAGKIAIQRVANPANLLRLEDGLFRIPSTETGSTLADPSTAPTRVLSGYLELSQVDLSTSNRRTNLAFHFLGPKYVTQNRLDVYIAGRGFFLVRDPVTDNRFATRAGAFALDAEGYVVTRDMTNYPCDWLATGTLGLGTGSNGKPTIPGLRLQGYIDSEMLKVGDLRIEISGKPPTDDTTIFIFSTGEIRLHLADGTQLQEGWVLLQEFADPYSLSSSPTPNDSSGRTSELFYSNLELAKPLAKLTLPETCQAGSVRQGALELVRPDRQPLSPSTKASAFVCRGIPGSTCVIQATTDFIHWYAAGTCVLDDSGRAEFPSDLYSKKSYSETTRTWVRTGLQIRFPSASSDLYWASDPPPAEDSVPWGWEPVTNGFFRIIQLP